MKMMDSNICIYTIKRKPPEVLTRFSEYAVGDLCVSSVTASELLYGAHKSARPEQNLAAIEQFLLPLLVLPFGYEAGQTYGKLRAYLEKQGTPIGPLDTLIAAHALHLNVPIVTNNTKEFARVPGLVLENWVE